MIRVLLIGALLALPTLAANNVLPEAPVMTISVDVEIVSYEKVCAKALAILVAREKITTQAAREFLMIPGDLTLRPGKCLEVIFTDASSPTNGYRVHTVSSWPGIIVGGG